jgi:hypothetical protein
MKARLVLPAAAVAAALAVAGCGSSGEADGGADVATLAPVTAPVFIDATIRPSGELRENVEDLAKDLAGVDDLGALIVEEAEKAAEESGEPLDYATDIEPWLGDEAGIYLERYDGEDFHGYGVAVAVTDTEAAQSFIDDHAESDDGAPFEGETYNGVDYVVDPEDETAVGLIGEFLAIAEDSDSFEAMVDASEGESLADTESYGAATAAVPGGSIANVFVDIGGLIDQSGGVIDPEAKSFLDTAGIDPEEATALASVVPGAEQVEIDVTSTLSGDNPPTGDASELLGSLPAGSVAAIASADFGKRFGEAIDEIDANGIPGEIPAGELKKTMKEAGIDLDRISGSVGDLAAFAEGSTENSLAGPGLPRSAASSAASRCAARTSATGRWSSPRPASGSRSPTGCRRPAGRSSPAARPSPAALPTKPPSAPSAAPRSAASSTAPRLCVWPRP